MKKPVGKTVSVRIDAELLRHIAEVAAEEGRTVKAQMERLIVVSLVGRGPLFRKK